MATLLSAVAPKTPWRNKQKDVKAVAVSNRNVEQLQAHVVCPDKTDDPHGG